MADGEGTAGTVLQDVSPALSAIPYVGGLLSLAANLGGGALKASAAKQQAARADALRKQQVPIQGIAPAYQRKLTLDEMTALAGTPGYEQAKDNLNATSAQNIRAIADHSPSGSATLSAIGNALYQKNLGLQKLDASNAAYRANGITNVSNDLGAIAGQQDEKMVQQHSDQALNNSAATNLENAATSNKYSGINQAINAVGALGKIKAGGGGSNASPDYLAYLKGKGYRIDSSGNLVPITQAVDSITSVAGNGSGVLQPTEDNSLDMAAYTVTN